jgi:hypothetical protein
LFLDRSAGLITKKMVQGSEEAAEFVATVRTEHVAMKTWYMGDSPAAVALKQKYGPYPGLWKEVLNWPGWKESRKEYLKEQQEGEGGVPDESPQISVPRKRKSRWGVAAPENKRPAMDSYAAPIHNMSNSIRPTPPLPLPLPQTQSLPPHKHEEMRQLQARLRIINEKLDHLEQEAGRVDALPRGHPDRSPSPPPSTYIPM